jgi:hypothetical protein
MLFYVDAKGKEILHPDAYKVNPNFKKLKDDEMRYVILATDYFSQFNQWPEVERKKKARGWVFGMDAKDPEDNPLVKQAIDEYNDLQFDQERQLFRVYQNKMRNLQILYQNESNPEKSDKYLASIEKLKKVMTELQRDISANTKINFVVKGGKGLTFLELLRRNKKYAEMQQERRNTLNKIDMKNKLEEHGKNKGENLIV